MPAANSSTRRARALLRSPALLAGLLSVAIALLCGLERSGLEIRWVDALERASLDQRFRWRGPVPTTGEVVIVAIDNDTLERQPELYQRRAGTAALVRAIAAAGPAAIGIDQVYVDPEEVLSPELTARVKEHVLKDMPVGAGPEGQADSLLREVARELAGDGELAAAVAEAGSVVLAIHLTPRCRCWAPAAGPGDAAARALRAAGRALAPVSRGGGRAGVVAGAGRGGAGARRDHGRGGPRPRGAGDPRGLAGRRRRLRAAVGPAGGAARGPRALSWRSSSRACRSADARSRWARARRCSSTSAAAPAPSPQCRRSTWSRAGPTRRCAARSSSSA